MASKKFPLDPHAYIPPSRRSLIVPLFVLVLLNLQTVQSALPALPQQCRMEEISELFRDLEEGVVETGNSSSGEADLKLQPSVLGDLGTCPLSPLDPVLHPAGSAQGSQGVLVVEGGEELEGRLQQEDSQVELTTWGKIKLKLPGLVGFDRPLRKEMTRHPYPKEQKTLAKVGLGVGLGVHFGTNGPEWATKPKGRSIYTFFIAPVFKKLLSNPVETVITYLFALTLAGLWETIWLYLFTAPYMKITNLQYNCQVELRKHMILKWRLICLYWAYAMLRCFMRLWGTGKWIAMIFLALMQMEKGDSLIGNLKVPIPSIIITWIFTVLPNFIYKLYGLWRQPSRRHGSNESTGLSSSGREPT